MSFRITHLFISPNCCLSWGNNAPPNYFFFFKIICTIAVAAINNKPNLTKSKFSLMKLCIQFFIALIICSSYSCDKKIPRPIIIKVSKLPKKSEYNNIIVGSGTGDLVIDGSLLSLGCNDTISIAAGSYNSISIKNIRSAEGCNVSIRNNGLVELDGDFKQMNLSNLKGVVITGNGDPAIKYGFKFHNNRYRAVVINKPYDNATLQFVELKNIGDYCINNLADPEYTGAENSFSRQLKFLNISCENTGSLLIQSGSVDNNRVTGLVKDLEIANLNFINSNAGTVVFCGNVEDYNIHHNRVDNINRENNEHNGIFHVRGNGRFHNNMVTNHQGNAIRAWSCTVGEQPKSVLIYNNIVVNSRKYSAFEVQSFSYYLSSKVTYANAMVYNNTCGSLNLSKDWYGTVVDVYDLQGGYCKVFNNLAFNFPSPNPANNFYNQQGPTIPEISSNLYFNTASAAGFSDQLTFTLTTNSPAKNAGLAFRSLQSDFYGNTRSRMHPSIGAVE